MVLVQSLIDNSVIVAHVGLDGRHVSSFQLPILPALTFTVEHSLIIIHRSVTQCLLPQPFYFFGVGGGWCWLHPSHIHVGREWGGTISVWSEVWNSVWHVSASCSLSRWLPSFESPDPAVSFIPSHFVPLHLSLRQLSIPGAINNAWNTEIIKM